MEHKKNRRVALLLITLIALVVLVAVSTAPLLVVFALGMLVGGILTFLSFVYWLIKR